MDFKTVVSEFGRRAGIPVALSANGTAKLVFDDDIAVQIEQDPSGTVLHFFTVIGNIPSDTDGRTVMYEALLSANLFGQGTGGAVLAIDTARNEVVLSIELSAQTASVELFEKNLETLLEHAPVWRANVVDYQNGTNTPEIPVAGAIRV